MKVSLYYYSGSELESSLDADIPRWALRANPLTSYHLTWFEDINEQLAPELSKTYFPLHTLKSNLQLKYLYYYKAWVVEF